MSATPRRLNVSINEAVAEGRTLLHGPPVRRWPCCTRRRWWSRAAPAPACAWCLTRLATVEAAARAALG